jgi:hypothetical protein
MIWLELNKVSVDILIYYTFFLLLQKYNYDFSKNHNTELYYVEIFIIPDKKKFSKMMLPTLTFPTNYGFHELFWF